MIMKINYKKLIGYILITIFIGSFFAFFTMDAMKSFSSVNQPSFSPPGYVFMIVWIILYILMGISLYLVDKDKTSVYVYFSQLVVNSLWTLIFFGFKNYLLSLLWIILLIGLVIYMIITFYKVNKTAAYLQIPYLLWISFATVLNYFIYMLN